MQNFNVIHVLVLYTFRLWHAIQHRTVLVIFPLILQIIIAAQVLHIGGERELVVA